MVSSALVTSHPDLNAAQHLVSIVERNARAAFAHVRCPGRRDDLIAESVALGWRYLRLLNRQAKKRIASVAVVARFAILAVLNGRRLCGSDSPHEARNPVVQGHRGAVRPEATLNADVLGRLTALSRRDRRVILALLRGERTSVIARRFGISRARVRHLRRDLSAGWQRYCDGRLDDAGLPGTD